ncbi:MAG: hypothetical protein OEX79_08120, partial [Nitrosopumilus sp.]|nr:hypothetical protein [Nitrosopumilus sp.]
KVKEQIIKAATETANMILRIDNIVASSSRGSAMPPSPGGMPGLCMAVNRLQVYDLKLSNGAKRIQLENMLLKKGPSILQPTLEPLNYLLFHVQHFQHSLL